MHSFSLSIAAHSKLRGAVCFALQLNPPSVLWKPTRNVFFSSLWESAVKMLPQLERMSSGWSPAMHELEPGIRCLHAPCLER